MSKIIVITNLLHLLVACAYRHPQSRSFSDSSASSATIAADTERFWSILATAKGQPFNTFELRKKHDLVIKIAEQMEPGIHRDCHAQITDSYKGFPVDTT